MDKVKDALEALKAKWSELSRLVKIAIVLGIISLFAIIGTVYYMNTRVEYSVLFSNLSEADAGTISQDLDSQNIKYKLADDGKTIMVDKTKVDQYRIDLAVDNKLPSSSKGFELFDSASMMTTDEDRKIMYQRALTGELENSIAALDDVDKAKVNLTIPKSDNVFDNSTSKKAKASIVLTLKGTSISKDAVQGIVALTTGAVQGLDKKNVKVVDQTGKILNKNEEDDASDSSSATSKYMKLKSQYEKQMEKKITGLIEPVVGKGKVKASVNVDLNFDAVEKKITNYSNPQVRSENVQASGKQAEIKQAQTGQVNDNVDNVTGDANNDNASYNRTVNNELNTEIAQTLLEHDGALVTTAANGKEALELFQAKPAGAFDAILMDVMMPKMNGYEATRAIRLCDKPDADEVPIIAMTANAFIEDIARAKESGMNDHLSKPIKIEKLKETLAKYRVR